VRAARLAAALALAGCGLEPPSPHVRLVRAAPEGPGAPVDGACELWFSGPIAADGLARIALVPAAAAGAARGVLDGEAAAGPPPGAVEVRASLEDGGRRAVLAPAAPLRGHAAYALVVGARLHDREGRPVLDAEGRSRGSVVAFETGARPGPPPRPALTELRADAATPEAGGEYVEVANLGEGPLDLLGWRLRKTAPGGAAASCLLEPSEAELVPEGGVALVAGGAWDGRYPVPAGVPVLRCGGGALLGGIANEVPPALALLDPGGVEVTTLGWGIGAPRCAEAVVRREPAGPDVPLNVGCGLGTPGWLP